MLALAPFRGPRPQTILCLGAHPDDIEIGCGATILRSLATDTPSKVVWVVFSGDGIREQESRRSAARFLEGLEEQQLVITKFQDGYFPFVGGEIKDLFEKLKRDVDPDLIFTHCINDRHQDHHLIADLTWQTFRDHLILEYEVPKYDGDLGSPNCYVPVTEAQCRAKIAHVLAGFESQREKDWFTEETFRGLMRVRGIECRAPSGYAEAFYARKIVVAPEGNEVQR